VPLTRAHALVCAPDRLSDLVPAEAFAVGVAAPRKRGTEEGPSGVGLAANNAENKVWTLPPTTPRTR